MADEGTKALEGMVKRHYERMVEAYPRMTVMHKLWKRLTEGDALRYAVESFAAEAGIAAKTGKHGYRASNFPGIYIAVSAVPSSDVSKAPAFFNGGYLTVCNQILNESGYLQGGLSLAHWIVCSEPGKPASIHLTFVADKFLAGDDTVNIFAQDMMTLSEKKEMGMA